MADEYEEPKRLSPQTVEVLENADRFELLSLDPDDRDGRGGVVPQPNRVFPGRALRAAKAEDRFFGWKILGGMDVDPSARRELLAALQDGIAENPGYVAGCFNPRHGIRARRGERLAELVICFECAQIQVYADGEQLPGVLITHTPQPLFDRVLSEAGIPLATRGG